MYLSRIELDTKKPETRRALASPNVLHAAVEGCGDNASEERKLWRVDSLRGRLYLLLLSPKKPRFASFAKQFSPPGQFGEIRPYDDLLSRINAGQVWRFRLRANPVHSVSDRKKYPARGKTYAHVTVEQQKDWLRGKTQSCGFELIKNEEGYECFDVIESDHICFRRKDRDGQVGFVSLGIATFEGVMQVTDAQKFVSALTAGIGRAKAYGCGLLTIADIP
jgi:CRISPR system Cascade subunit CasE